MKKDTKSQKFHFIEVPACNRGFCIELFQCKGIMGEWKKLGIFPAAGNYKPTRLKVPLDKYEFLSEDIFYKVDFL